MQRVASEEQTTKLQASLGNLQRAILQAGGLETPSQEVVVIKSDDDETVVESSSQSLEIPRVFSPRSQSTPKQVHHSSTNTGISADQYQYLHSVIKDQAEKLRFLETEMVRVKAEMKKLKASPFRFCECFGIGCLTTTFELP